MQTTFLGYRHPRASSYDRPSPRLDYASLSTSRYTSSPRPLHLRRRRSSRASGSVARANKIQVCEHSFTKLRSVSGCLCPLSWILRGLARISLFPHINGSDPRWHADAQRSLARSPSRSRLFCFRLLRPQHIMNAVNNMIAPTPLCLLSALFFLFCFLRRPIQDGRSTTGCAMRLDAPASPQC